MRSTPPPQYAGVDIPPSGDSRQRKAYESRREREFYSYYAPVLSMAGKAPQLCDLNDPQSVAAHRPSSSPDKALTAFVQLTALRLRARRSMLFCFDTDYAYILAEATRTLSLQDDSQHDIDDSLWLGTAKIPRGFSVCEVTADLPANDGSNAEDLKSKSIIHIVNNLEKDTRFCGRPFVTNGPMARFYAGVPITTAKGINIGALCVLDEKPRDGMDEGEVQFLTDMAKTAMTHLEMVRAKQEIAQSHNMVTALGKFVVLRSEHISSQSTRGPRQVLSPAAKRLLAGTEGDEENATTPPSSAMKHKHKHTPSRDGARHKQHPKGVDLDNTAQSARETTQATNAANNIETEEFAPQPSSGEAVHAADALEDDQLATQIKATMDCAAGLFRKAIDVDGVVFLDAAINTFEGHVSSDGRLNETDSGTGSTDTPRVPASANSPDLLRRPAPSSDQYTYSSGPPVALCPILGSSFAPKDTGRHDDSLRPPKITEDFLKGLLRRYPEGRAWHFNPDGEASSDDMTEDNISTAESADSDSMRTSTPSSRRLARRLRARVKDGRLIQDIFPGVRSLILVGMWDSHKDCWYGASLLWSYSPTRILSRHIELPYISAFCEVVLSEVWRLEAQMVDRSKNDFISSISHELRSPLHGILGSAECLEDREHDAVSQELVRSILSCGTTLLDIINQLLQYSRLDNGAQQRLTRLQRFESGQRYPSHPSTKDDGATPKVGASLSALTEEAVNAACSGFDHQGLTPYGASASPMESVEAKRDVTVILDIDEPYHQDWSFLITPGVWKRICMNLVSNALKYTPSGHIRIALSKRWLSTASGDARNAQISLVIEDTGVGMSQAFQVKNLFRPFKQENILAQGTGLGLNLVAKLAKAEGGTVHVKSKKGEGTSVCVTLPLQVSALHDATAEFEDLARDGHGSLVDLIGFVSATSRPTSSTVLSDAQHKLSSGLQATLKQYGMRTRFPKSGDGQSEPAKLQVVQEAEVHNAVKRQPTDDDTIMASVEPISIDVPCIVVCATRASACRLRDSYAQDGIAEHNQFLWHPIGPGKLATAISAALTPVLKESERPHTESIGTNNEEERSDMVPGAFDRDASPQSARTLPDLQKVDLALRSRAVDKAKAHGLTMPQESPPVFDNPSLVEIDKFAIQDGRQESPTSSIPLLLVDDNPVNLRILTVFAKKAGYPYTSAPDGLKALDAYKRAAKKDHDEQSDSEAIGSSHARSYVTSKPAVILMDINMPVMDGHEATRRIRQFEKESKARRATIIALTGLGSKEAQEISFACGVDLFLTKPVRLKELAAILLKMRAAGQETEPS